MQMALADTADVSVTRMDALDPALLEAPGTLWLLCAATHGAGDPTDDAQELLAALAAQPRYLGAMRYGVFALGDSSYGDTFCGGAKAIGAALADLGAQRLGPIHCHDAMDGEPAEAAAAAFADRWWAEHAAVLHG